MCVCWRSATGRCSPAPGTRPSACGTWTPSSAPRWGSGPSGGALTASHSCVLHAQAEMLRRRQLRDVVAQVLEGHLEAVLALAVGNGHLISGSYDTTVSDAWFSHPISWCQPLTALRSPLVIRTTMSLSWCPALHAARRGSSICSLPTLRAGPLLGAGQPALRAQVRGARGRCACAGSGRRPGFLRVLRWVHRRLDMTMLDW